MRNFILAVTLSVTCTLFVVACAYSYEVTDLPPGWEFDPNQIDGEILPAIADDPNSPIDPSDPNSWLVPMGPYARVSECNKWVKQINWIRTTTSDGVFLHHDPNTGWSQWWEIQGWSLPGPWYKTIEAETWRGRSGLVKTQRYTIVGAGYVPADVFPVLY